MYARDIIEKFGSQSALADLLGRGQTTVAYWAKTGVIPAKWQARILDLARERGIELSPADFMSQAAKSGVATLNINGNSNLVAIQPSKQATTNLQARLDLGIDK